MIIKGQNQKCYDIYEFMLSGKVISCKDNADRRCKHTLGVYNSVQRATDVFQEMRNETSGYYEMPQE